MFLDIIKYYSVIKRNEVLIHATTLINFKHIMPSENLRHAMEILMVEQHMDV